MIAANYLKHPDALRFQRELFHNGFKNSPRIMRLMECVFKFAPEVPQWAKDLARKARQLVKLWKGCQIALNFAEAVARTIRMSKVGYVWGNGPNGHSPKFEALLATGRTYEELSADDSLFYDEPIPPIQ